ncbi:hypothetical protein G3N56_04535 [Desulfovibrio sulfodismutans]|uniref:Uncharacterized protein n=1 Tax=Desulfolutivibrio sulfodismutans TaxID=63561 RepID=A0A7K3NIJ3_9BACT|nr:hypothetical protein [Desulfolutivibrio sulfodismutans]NDY56012.1 hypothetical protein [Desulfolutivibrio sulfodismutans]QLA13251.1 hypothetical protein GD606_13730 [Desulfolutivibrio sulfodismutans DSM 3696]
MTTPVQITEHGVGRYAGSATAMEIVSDSTLCLMPHSLPRHCPACGTVFHGSVISPVATGAGAACPYCLHSRTLPISPQ